MTQQLKELEKRLRAALANCEQLEKENILLKQQLIAIENVESKERQLISKESDLKQKIELYRGLFRGRDDVYTLRWESNNGKSGYSPVCRNEWHAKYCRKPHIKCWQCINRKYLPITDNVIDNHLSGKQIIGLYPLLQNNTCYFLVIDFDKSGWQEDVLIFLETCEGVGVSVSLERSRSGNGGHVWLFFAEPIEASIARKLGRVLLDKAIYRRYQIGLESYDRMFPNQDVRPKGGFGNLIALPLQRQAAKKGNSLFIDEELRPYQDQWAYLSNISKLSLIKIKAIIGNNKGKSQVVNADLIGRNNETFNEDRVNSLPSSVSITKTNLIYVKKNGLSSAVINSIIKLSSFSNPEFYKSQRLRLSTHNIPRVINCADDFPSVIGLPRGCMEDVLKLFERLNIKVRLSDNSFQGVPIEADFLGELDKKQLEAAKELVENDCGILSAATGFGKTVIASWIIAARKVNTLVIVHRQPLIDQWKEQLSSFLSINSVGQVGGGKSQSTKKIDIATIQSLYRKGNVNEIIKNYGQVIVDECHHVSAFSFEQVLKQVRAQYVLGLTATPIRKDGHHPIMAMQCGPIRYRVTDKEQSELRPFRHILYPRETGFALPSGATETNIASIFRLLIEDEERNTLIFDDVLKALDKGRSPLLLTERVQHLQYFEKKFKGFVKHVVTLSGGNGINKQRAVFEQLKKIPDNQERIVIATGRFIGEGFNDSRFDTLFLTLPISWKGTLQQYAGRLHRNHKGKQIVQIYDYVDNEVPVLNRMFSRRLKGYRALGYEMKTIDQPLNIQLSI